MHKKTVERWSPWLLLTDAGRAAQPSARAKAQRALLDALRTAITDARAGNLDQIASDRMAKLDALEARLPLERALYLDNLANPPLRIKSIQRGFISLIGAETSASATVIAVDTSKSVLTHLGNRRTGGSNTDELPYLFCTLGLTNSTTVTAMRQSGFFGSSISNDAIVSWQLTEYF